MGIAHNQALSQYFHWMFRVNFLFLFALCCLVFFALTILFAGFITLAGRIDADCVRVGEQPFGYNFAAFADAFALSWSTFSTVVCYNALWLCIESVVRLECRMITSCVLLVLCLGLWKYVSCCRLAERQSDQLRLYYWHLLPGSLYRCPLLRILWRRFVWKGSSHSKSRASHF